jgi:hypothetical protein
MAQLGESLARTIGRTVKPASSESATRMDYPEARRAAASDDAGVRLSLAQRDDVQPEVLYYLAEDDEPGVRRAVAANEATPRQADALLVDDVDDEVRISLARKISRLAPDLNTAAQGWLARRAAPRAHDHRRGNPPSRQSAARADPPPGGGCRAHRVRADPRIFAAVERR